MPLNDEQKEQLRLVLAHEYRRCDQAFIDFLDHSENLIGLGWSKKRALSTYDSYARFIHHLYEFYVGCFKRNKNSLNKIDYIELDNLFQTEAEKLMGLRRWRIERGDAGTAKNQLSYYDMPVPDTFGTDFRRMRNRIAHTDLRRSGTESSITLSKFFYKYHKFILVLYEEPHHIWHVRADSFDWGEIENFGKAINNNAGGRRKYSMREKIGRLILHQQIKDAISYRRKNSS